MIQTPDHSRIVSRKAIIYNVILQNSKSIIKDDISSRCCGACCCAPSRVRKESHTCMFRTCKSKCVARATMTWTEPWLQ